MSPPAAVHRPVTGIEYFGFPRRDPDDPPDANLGGFNFWPQKMNEHTLPGEDARTERDAFGLIKRAEVVRAHILSVEYRQRFGRSSRAAAERGGPAVSHRRPSPFGCARARGSMLSAADPHWLSAHSADEPHSDRLSACSLSSARSASLALMTSAGRCVT